MKAQFEEASKRLFDPNPKNKIWEGERVTSGEYEHRLKVAQTLEIQKGLESVQDYDTSGFDEELYKDEQFVPAILETLVLVDERAILDKKVGLIRQFRVDFADRYANEPWYGDFDRTVDRYIDSLEEEFLELMDKVREANADVTG